uniref:Uncharacterized protein n=2 Tax=viral metagenome TaxID=1070528 RepID=A0A6H2A289_9ZZZZ
MGTKVRKNEVLDSILAGTGFSSKTKSLLTYFNSGITPRMGSIIIVSSGIKKINKEDILAFAIWLTNRIWNHGSHFPYNIFQYENYRAIGVDKEKLLKIYKRMKPATIKRWKEAIELIDNYKK